MKGSYSDRVARVKSLLRAADRVIVGGGSGLSAAAGLKYAGERFERNFRVFKERYGLTDMYTSAFYPFETQEEKWAYWSRHVYLNRYKPGALDLYRRLFDLVSEKDCFVVTTNVDYQFYKAGFSSKRIFAVQGDYGLNQCARGCHDTLYENERLIKRMRRAQEDCRVPSALVPKCPVCGGEMEIHIRKDEHFVQDERWYAASEAYSAFAEQALKGKTALLEIGVGYNTPAIIRFPFEQLTQLGEDVTLVRINKEFPEAVTANADRTISFSQDAWDVVTDLASR